MSRVGKVPIRVPKGVEVTINGSQVRVKGPKGELSQSFHQDMIIALDDDLLTVSRPSDNRLHRSLHGLTRTLLANIVEGVSQGFQKTLEIVGVGYRAQMTGGKLMLQVGYSHQVEIVPPPSITLEVEGNNRIHVRGIDRQMVGQIAAKIRAVKPPDPYKGKGIRYAGEQVRLKPGKGAVKTI